MSRRTHRFSLGFTQEEIEAFRAHPDYTGSVPELVRMLALAAVGVGKPDPYVNHRERPRDPHGRLVPKWVACLRAAFDAHGGATDLHRDLSSAKSGGRVVELLAPIFAASPVLDREAYAEVLLRLQGPDWEDVRNMALLANSAYGK